MVSAVLEAPSARAGAHVLDCQVSWSKAGQPAARLTGEPAVQAASGLMHLHGLDGGRPRRLGLDVCSVAAGLLAAQGVLAASVGQARGVPISRVETTVVHAALLTISQYIARATCADGWGEWSPAVAGDGPGPPFPTADGRWLELEVMSPEAWASFWSALGVPQRDFTSGWNSFVARYSTASCNLPSTFREATARRPVSELVDLAQACNVSVTPIRCYAEVTAQEGWAALAHPMMTPLSQSGGHESSCAAALDSESDRARSPSFPQQALPLEGIEVVEATSRVQGPLAGLLLRMLGARVVRVEPPGGDVARIEAPLAGNTGAFFAAMNRGKEGVEIDLATASGRRSLVDRIARADVFLHNWRPGKAAEWGLEAGDMASRNPKLVYCHASGWGPMAVGRPPIAMDFLVQAHAGLGDGLNPIGEEPFPSRVLLSDFFGGLVGCEGVLAGLSARERSGCGARIDTSLLGGAMAVQAQVLDAMVSGNEVRRRAGRPLWGPLDHPLPTADGHLSVTVDDRADLGRLCNAVRIADVGDSSEAVDRLVRQLAERPAVEWEPIVSESGLSCAVVRDDLASLPGDPALGDLLEPLGGRGRAPTSPWRFSP